MFINVARGYSDIATDTITDDAIMMPIGFIIVFVYVTFMLGRLDCLQQRSMLAGAGLFCQLLFFNSLPNFIKQRLKNTTK